MATPAEVLAQSKLAKIKAEKEALENGTVVVEVEERTYQTYKSSRKATRIVTPKGARLKFTNHQYLTDNEDIIAYLDAEIKSRGIPGLSKGTPVTSVDLDPMAKLEKELRTKIEAEFLEKAKNKALGITRAMGTTAKQGIGDSLATSNKTASGPSA